MKVAAVFVILVLSLGVANASDFIGVYALISGVNLEPNAENAQRIQISGIFVIADPKDSRSFGQLNGILPSYLPPQRGYLYFSIPAASGETVHKEWSDLSVVAGTGQVVSFGTRAAFQKARVRNLGVKPASPDDYALGIGVIRIRTDTNYAPVKSLLELNSYLPPQRGYLYFMLPQQADQARREWLDLNNMAGTGKVVALGVRGQMLRVRASNEKPDSPDKYQLGIGLTVVRPDYAPVKAILEFAN